MSAPDELRQLANRLNAEEGHPDGGDITLGDLAAAAVALRHHANLLDAIGDPDELAALAFYGTAGNGHGDDLSELIERIVKMPMWTTATISPPPTTPPLTGDCSVDCLERCAHPGIDSACEIGAPPAPTTCPTCGSDNPLIAGGRRTEPCPDSWHQQAT